MILTPKNFRSVHFSDFIVVNPDDKACTIFDISVQGELTQESYCKSLYSKVLTIGLSESNDFLNYQCELHKNPIKWLNGFEKLIKVNFENLKTENLRYRNMKFMMEIITKRQTIKFISEQNAGAKKQFEALNGYTGDKVYCFKTVLEDIKSMKITEEKILYLKAQIKDYKQNPPEFVSNRNPKFDEQCQLEINSLFEAEELMEKAIEKRKQSAKSSNKLRVNAELKTICDFYYKLMKKKGNNGQPIYPWSIKEATAFICNSFMDMQGNPFNPSTVRTYLSPSKYNSRPKSHKEIDLDE